MIEETGCDDRMAAIVPATTMVCLATINIRDVKIDAEIGVLPHELGRSQPLLINVTLHVRPVLSDELEDTIDYSAIVDAARELGTRPTGLVETFARRLAEICLRWPSVGEADVLVEKPAALPAGVAGARVILRRDNAPLVPVKSAAILMWFRRLWRSVP